MELLLNVSPCHSAERLHRAGNLSDRDINSGNPQDLLYDINKNIIIEKKEKKRKNKEYPLLVLCYYLLPVIFNCQACCTAALKSLSNNVPFTIMSQCSVPNPSCYRIILSYVDISLSFKIPCFPGQFSVTECPELTA
jgi:hypothetical protein